jgi:hypothetical protein
MAPRIDIIDILLGRNFHSGGFVDGGRTFDELAARLAGGRPVQEPSLGDFLAEMLSPPTAEEHQESINDAIEQLQALGVFKNLQPATNRSRVHINADTVFIGAEGFPDGHPHHNLLIRSLKKADRWRLWSLCPGKKTSRAFQIKGVEDIEEATRIANIVLDLGLHLIDEETYVQAALKTRREKREAERERGKPVVAAEAPKPAAE